MILSLVAIVIRFALLAAFTFAFVVLFEHGPDKYLESAKTEWQALSGTLESMSRPEEKPIEPGT